MRADAKALVGKSRLPKEPVLDAGIKVFVVTGIISGITTLVDIPDKYQLVMYIVLSFLVPFVTALLARRTAWSPKSVQEIIEQATKEAYDTYKEINEIKTNKPSPKLL